MKCHQPQLTNLEQRLLFGISEEEGLRRFFWMWTLKEAYTKALGMGLGFDFSRVEFDVPEGMVRVDGEVPRGWRFHKFIVNQGEDVYQGVVAEYVGEDEKTMVISEFEAHPWLHIMEAASFIDRAVQELTC